MNLCLAAGFGVAGFLEYNAYSQGEPRTLAGSIILWSMCALCLVLHAFTEKD